MIGVCSLLVLAPGYEIGCLAWFCFRLRAIANDLKKERGRQGRVELSKPGCLSTIFQSAIPYSNLEPSTCVQPRRFARSALAVRKHLSLLGHIGEMACRAEARVRRVRPTYALRATARQPSLGTV